MKENIIKEKSFTFALHIVELYKVLRYQKGERVMSQQILKSGTSIGANIAESVAGFSKKDFCAKLSISSKEAHETLYWLQLLERSDYITSEQAKPLINDCKEIIKILSSIILTLQQSS